MDPRLEGAATPRGRGCAGGRWDPGDGLSVVGWTGVAGAARGPVGARCPAAEDAVGVGASCAAGGLAGVLVAPTTFIAPNSFDLLLVFGFTAAVIGGLDSLIGGVLGGLALGIGLSVVTGYLGGSYTFMTAFVLLITILLVRPQGILGARGARRA